MNNSVQTMLAFKNRLALYHTPHFVWALSVLSFHHARKRKKLQKKKTKNTLHTRYQVYLIFFSHGEHPTTPARAHDKKTKRRYTPQKGHHQNNQPGGGGWDFWTKSRTAFFNLGIPPSLPGFRKRVLHWGCTAVDFFLLRASLDHTGIINAN